MARSKQLTRLDPWHHDLIDWMLANPAKSGREAAGQFGVSPVWISILKHSPVFRVEFERRREMISRAVAADIVGRARALAELSLDTMTERIERDGDRMPMRDLIDGAAMGLKALGFGAGKRPPAGASPGKVQVNVVDRELLERARERMRRHSRARGGDGEPALPADR